MDAWAGPRADSRGNRRYFTVASAPTEESVRLGVKFYPAVQRLQARARARWSRATRSTPRSSPATSRCRPIRDEARLPRRRHRHHAVPQHAAVSPRPEGGATDRHPLRKRDARRTSPIATSSMRPDSELGIRTVHAVARGAAARPISRLHRRAPGARGDSRLSRAHVLHLRPAGDGEGAPRRCCCPWAFAARG